MRARFVLAAGLIAATSLSPAPAAPPAPAALAGVFGNTIVCKQADGPATCRVWLDPDMRYVVTYDLGVQTEPTTAAAQFREEGRTGRYRVTGTGDATQVCLTPEAIPSKKFGMDRMALPFGGAGCYAIGAHSAGETWAMTDARGRQFSMWLVKGR